MHTHTGEVERGRRGTFVVPPIIENKRFFCHARGVLEDKKRTEMWLHCTYVADQSGLLPCDVHKEHHQAALPLPRCYPSAVNPPPPPPPRWGKPKNKIQHTLDSADVLDFLNNGRLAELVPLQRPMYTRVLTCVCYQYFSPILFFGVFCFFNRDTLFLYLFLSRFCSVATAFFYDYRRSPQGQRNPAVVVAYVPKKYRFALLVVLELPRVSMETSASSITKYSLQYDSHPSY